MPFEEFMQWLSNEVIEERQFETLGGRSFFHASYDQNFGIIRLRLRTNTKGQLRNDQIQIIFNRWENGGPNERYRTSFYTDPWWPDTPNRIFAPTIPAIIRAWMQNIINNR